jgi:tetratricopeptide (TPR) repeat protein
LEKLKKFEKALKYYKTALGEDKKSFMVIYRMAKSYFGLQKYKRTEEMIKKIFFLCPDHAGATYLSGVIKLKDDPPNVEEAMTFLKKALALTKKSRKTEQQIYRAMGKCKELEGNLNEAIFYCLQAKQSLSTKDLIEEIALLYVKMQDLWKAIEKYKEILSDYKDDAKIYLEIGSLYALLSEFQKSRKYLSQAVVLDPELSIGKIRLAKIEYNNFRNFLKSEELLESISAPDPELYKAKYQLGFLNWKFLG